MAAKINTNTSKIDKNFGTQTNSSNSVAKQENVFTDQLKQSRLKMFNGDMNELMQIVKRQGEKFIKSPDSVLLKSYKESVKSFLTKLKDEFISLKEEFGASRDRQQKVYQLVESVDSDVQALTKELLNENKAVSLLADLDDIRGLVLDIIG